MLFTNETLLKIIFEIRQKVPYGNQETKSFTYQS